MTSSIIATTPAPVISSCQLVPLPHDFYLQPTASVARQLIGRYLVRDGENGALKIGRIVETEAYVGAHDRASHSSHGKTARTAPMFGEGGHAYVYFVYGMHWCLNVVTEGAGTGAAVLLRACEAITGLDTPLNGPARLARSFGVNGAFNGSDFEFGELRITGGKPVPQTAIAESPRIGVGYAGEWSEAPLRYYDVASPAVSRQPGKPRTTHLAQRKHL